MDYKYIEQLLDRYFQGETSLHEEQILKAFFAQGMADMPACLQQYAPLFSVLAEQPQLDASFDERVLALTEPATATTVELKGSVKARTVSLRERLRPLFGAAAVVAILLTLAGAIDQSLRGTSAWVDMDDYAVTAQDEPQVATEGPAVAYEQPADSLSLLRDGLNTPLPPDTLTAGRMN